MLVCCFYFFLKVCFAALSFDESRWQSEGEASTVDRQQEPRGLADRGTGTGTGTGTGRGGAAVSQLFSALREEGGLARLPACLLACLPASHTRGLEARWQSVLSSPTNSRDCSSPKDCAAPEQVLREPENPGPSLPYAASQPASLATHVESGGASPAATSLASRPGSSLAAFALGHKLWAEDRRVDRAMC